MKNYIKHVLTLYVLRPKANIEFLRPVWLFLNRGPRELYKKHPPVLNALQQKIVDDLKRDGMSLTHIDDLFADQPEIYKAMCDQLPGLVANAVQDPKKAHFKILWHSRFFHLDPNNPFVRFALSDRLVGIANAYFGMWTRLLLSNGYIADPTNDGKKINTQNWHRDAHDNQLLSVFMYLTDVNSERDGALWYIKGSQPGGPLGTLFPQRKPHSVRLSPTDAEMEANIPADKFVVCTGRKGTLVICDATGLHRGGYCTENRRIMVLTDFASNHRFRSTLRLSYPQSTNELREALSPQGQYAAHLI